LQAGALHVNGAGSAFERPIRIICRPSLRVTIVLVVMHLGAFAAIALSGIPVAAKLASGALVGASLFAHSRRMQRGFLEPEPPVLQLDGRDEWHLLRAGNDERMTPGSDTVALPWLVVLHLRDAARTGRFFILTTDNVPSDALRRLCVRLRYPLDAD
jgi:hypothetical protein